MVFGRKAVQKAPRLKELLTTNWDVVCCIPEEMPPDEMQEMAQKAKAVVSGRPNSALPRLPVLELFQIPFAGYDWIQPDELPSGSLFCNAYEHEPAIAEYLMLAMLESEIGLLRDSLAFRAKSWDGRTAGAGPTHGELRGKSLGIIGYGHIGKELATRAAAFGMRIAAIANRPKALSAPLEWLGTQDDLGRLLQESDYLAVCCPLTDQTRDLLDAAAFNAMKPNAVIINVARGPIVNEEALFTALKDKRIKGAVIDVWYQYPSLEDPAVPPSRFAFQDLDNVVMTPHNSGWTEETIDRRWKFVAANLDRLARGEALQNVAFEGTGTRD